MSIGHIPSQQVSSQVSINETKETFSSSKFGKFFQKLISPATTLLQRLFGPKDKDITIGSPTGFHRQVASGNPAVFTKNEGTNTPATAGALTQEALLAKGGLKPTPSAKQTVTEDDQDIHQLLDDVLAQASKESDDLKVVNDLGVSTEQGTSKIPMPQVSLKDRASAVSTPNPSGDR